MTDRQRRVAMLGTRGVPASYGGFETAVEEVGSRLAAEGYHVTVYCRSRPNEKIYKGMELVWAPSLRSKSLETLSHTLACLPHLLSRKGRPDVVILFNSGNAILLPLIKCAGMAVILHPDGLEWQRAKWSPLIRRLFRESERLAIRLADFLIADAEALQQYYLQWYGRESEYIAYGAAEPVYDASLIDQERMPAPWTYHLLVARFEPENHVLDLIRGFMASDHTTPLYVVGGPNYPSAYASLISEEAHQDSRIKLLGPIYNTDALNYLYANCRSYWHGHSVGGTNPSLLRALGAGAPVIAHENAFNREVARDAALYVSDSAALTKILDDGSVDAHIEHTDRARVKEMALIRFSWARVAQSYARMVDRAITARLETGTTP
jgi:glycosyltransferase involved in cell wall biosynthesis